MREQENLLEVSRFQPDFLGFIFYNKSPRYVGNLDPTILDKLPKSIKKVGVFVNESLGTILTAIHNYNLDAVQLHGADNRELCRVLKEDAKVMVIKVFPVSSADNLKVTKSYEAVSDYFLFDTQTELHGGSGQKFNWQILHEYKGETPVFLSGGIAPDDIKAIRKLMHPKMIGIDLNSRFENKPAVKNVELLREFIDELKKPVNDQTNRIHQLFSEKGNNTLSIYITAGYPTLNSTLPTLEALQNNGVDIIEIGIPFSDPMADGPVIQESSHTALANGMNIITLFEQLSPVREKINIPLVLMSYLNPVMQFGFEEFCSECKRVGIDGIIIPDLPMEDYLADYKQVAEQYGIEFIFLISPETSEERIREIDQNSGGFIYMVSSAAVTGTKESFEMQTDYFERVKAMNLTNPRLIGFGISNKKTLEAAYKYASGAIIGSAFIKALNKSSSPDEAIRLLLEQLGR